MGVKNDIPGGLTPTTAADRDTIASPLGDYPLRELATNEPQTALNNGGVPFGYLIDSLGKPYTPFALENERWRMRKHLPHALYLFIWPCLGVSAFVALIAFLSSGYWVGAVAGIITLALLSCFINILEMGKGKIAAQRLGAAPLGQERHLIWIGLQTKFFEPLFAPPPEKDNSDPQKMLEIDAKNRASLIRLIHWLYQWRLNAKVGEDKLREAVSNSSDRLNILNTFIGGDFKTGFQSHLETWHWHNTRPGQWHREEANRLERIITDGLNTFIYDLRDLVTAHHEITGLLNVPHLELRDQQEAVLWIVQNLSERRINQILAQIQANPLATKLPES